MSLVTQNPQRLNGFVPKTSEPLSQKSCFETPDIACYTLNTMKTISKYIPRFLLFVYAVVFTWGAIEPSSRAVWKVENGPIFAIALILTVLYIRGTRFSNLSYILMSVLLIWHTIGGHYTFELVPFDWFSDMFGFERNMYDRIGHFSVGFYAFPIFEYLLRSGKMSRPLAYAFGLFTIAFVAMGYELVEWIYAVMSDPTAGAAFLGSQGDIWDAQKDMAMDTLGALVMIPLHMVLRGGKDLPENRGN